MSVFAIWFADSFTQLLLSDESLSSSCEVLTVLSLPVFLVENDNFSAP